MVNELRMHLSTSHELSVFERIFMECPEDCLCNIFAYMGFSSFLTLSSSSRTLFSTCLELDRVWHYFGRTRNLPHFFLELAHKDEEQLDNQNLELPIIDPPSNHSFRNESFRNDSFHNDKHPFPDDPQTPPAPPSSTFHSVPSRSFFSSVGLEMQSWKSQTAISTSFQSLPVRKVHRPEKEGKSKRELARENVVKMVPSRQSCTIDNRSHEVRDYMDRVIHLGRLVTSRSHPEFQSHSSPSSPFLTSPRLKSSQSQILLRTIQSLPESDLPIMSICNGRIYSTDFQNQSSRIVPELQLPVLPHSIGFFPKPLMQGAGAQTLTPSSPSGLSETRGTSGRASVSAASWIAIRSSPNEDPPRKKTKRSRDGAEQQSEALTELFEDHMKAELPLPASHVGFLAVGYYPSTILPDVLTSSGTIGCLSLLSILKQPPKGNEKSALTRSRQESFVAFVLKAGEVICSVDGLMIIDDSIMQRTTSSGSSSKYRSRFSHVEFPMEGQSRAVNLHGHIAIGTSSGRVLCSRPRSAQSDRCVEDKVAAVNAAWKDLYFCLNQELASIDGTMQSSYDELKPKDDFTSYQFHGSKFQFLLESCFDKGTISIEHLDRIVQSHGIASLSHLYAYSLSDGILYDEVSADDYGQEVDSLQVLGETPWKGYNDANHSSSWILFSIKDVCIKLLRFDRSFLVWQTIHVFQGPIQHAHLQPTTGLLAVSTRLDSKLQFFSFNAYASTCFSSHFELSQPEPIPSSALSVQYYSKDSAVSKGVYLVSSSPTLIRPLNGDRWAAVVNRAIRVISIPPQSKPGPLNIRPISVLIGHRSRIYACEFDGVRRLASIDCNEQVIIWDVRKKQKLYDFSLYSKVPKWPGSLEDEEDFMPSEEDELATETPPKENIASRTFIELPVQQQQPDVGSSIQFPSLDTASPTARSPQFGSASWSSVAGRPSSSIPSRPLPMGVGISPEVQRQWKLPEDVQIRIAMDISLSDVAQLSEEKDIDAALRLSLKTDPEKENEGDETIQTDASTSLSEVHSSVENVGTSDSEIGQEMSDDLRSVLMAATQTSGLSIHDEYKQQLEQLERIAKSPDFGDDRRCAERLQNKMDERESQTKMYGLLAERSNRNSIFNPQSREIAWLAMSPRRLSVLYKRQRLWQSWRF